TVWVPRGAWLRAKPTHAKAKPHASTAMSVPLRYERTIDGLLLRLTPRPRSAHGRMFAQRFSSLVIGCAEAIHKSEFAECSESPDSVQNPRVKKGEKGKIFPKVKERLCNVIAVQMLCKALTPPYSGTFSGGDQNWGRHRPS